MLSTGVLVKSPDSSLETPEVSPYGNCKDFMEASVTSGRWKSAEWALTGGTSSPVPTLNNI